MITKEMLIPNETVLIEKETNEKFIYMDCGKNENYFFLDNGDDFIAYTIKELNEYFTIEQIDKTVPLEQKVYDFVDVLVRDIDSQEWKEVELIAVKLYRIYPYIVLDKNNNINNYKQCKFK